MTWINNANAAAINVQITDPIPAGTTYVTTPLPNGSVSWCGERHFDNDFLHLRFRS